jgi:hypothetical protein
MGIVYHIQKNDLFQQLFSNMIHNKFAFTHFMVLIDKFCFVFIIKLYNHRFMSTFFYYYLTILMEMIVWNYVKAIWIMKSINVNRFWEESEWR